MLMVWSRFVAARRRPSGLQATRGLNPLSSKRGGAPINVSTFSPSLTSQTTTWVRLTPASNRPSGLNARPSRLDGPTSGEGWSRRPEGSSHTSIWPGAEHAARSLPPRPNASPCTRVPSGRSDSQGAVGAVSPGAGVRQRSMRAPFAAVRVFPFASADLPDVGHAADQPSAVGAQQERMDVDRPVREAEPNLPVSGSHTASSHSNEPASLGRRCWRPACRRRLVVMCQTTPRRGGGARQRAYRSSRPRRGRGDGSLQGVAIRVRASPLKPP